MTVQLRWGSASHQGRVRSQNEDALLAGPTVFAVADGMGGHAGGEVASAIAVAELATVDSTAPDQVTDALHRTNAEIRRRAAVGDGPVGMGSTVAGVVVGDHDALVFNLGDSRVYRLRGNALEQLTEDHSLVADMVRSGEISAPEARTHPQRNVITRALGVEPDIEPAVSVVEHRVGDTYLIASDGLFNELTDEQMADLLARDASIEHRARQLLDAALEHGGRDNISVVLVSICDPTDDSDLLGDTNPQGAVDAPIGLITSVPAFADSAQDLRRDRGGDDG